MENLPQLSTDFPSIISSDPRVLAMCEAVAGGMIVRVAIARHFGSRATYYAQVSMADKLFIRRLSLERVFRMRKRKPLPAPGQVRVTVFLESARHRAICRRTEQLSTGKGRLISANEYINSLIAADLRQVIDTIDSN